MKWYLEDAENDKIFIVNAPVLPVPGMAITIINKDYVVGSDIELEAWFDGKLHDHPRPEYELRVRADVEEIER